MIFSYLVPLLLILLIYQFYKQKKSIRNRGYDYRYYEEGPYGEKKKKTWFDRLKDWLPFCWLILFSSALFSSCRPDPQPISKQYPIGYFCVNEGIFGQTSGTLTHFNPNTRETTDQLFSAVNDRPLGNVVQSLYFHDNQAYIVVNNSNKIEIADGLDFSSVGQITNLQQPRYLCFNNQGDAFVSQWGDDGISGRISKIDINSSLTIQTELIGKGPEKLAYANQRLYIPLSGGYQIDHQIKILDDQTLQCIDSIEVNDRPLSCEIDHNGYLWVLCSGNTVYSVYPNIDTSLSTAGAILQIDTSTKAIVKQISMAKGVSLSTLKLHTDQNILYYLKNGAIYQYSLDSDQEILIADNGFYGLGFDPVQNYVLGAVNNGINPSKVYIFNGSSPIDSFDVGTFPNTIVVK